MRTRTVTALGVAFAVCIIAACSGSDGGVEVQDVPPETGGTDTSTSVDSSDESSSDSATTDSSADADASDDAPLDSPADAAADADSGPACTDGGSEVCDDGIDNDCNGLADCEDPACTVGYACAAPAPVGWTLVAFNDIAQPTCPAGYSTSIDLRVLEGNGAHTCPCSCVGSGGSGPTCAGVLTAVTTGDDPACAAGQTTANLSSTTAGVCTALPATLTIGAGASEGFGKITTPTGPASCAPSPAIAKADPTDGRTCAPPTITGTGCSGANRCLPKPTGYTLCVQKDGDQTCPVGFVAKRRRAGTTSNDGRVCQSCTCNAATPCSGTVDLWTNAACNSAKTSRLTTAGNSACAAPEAGSSANVSATHYKSTITGGCSVNAPSVVQGALTFGGERTICCQ